MADDIKLVVGVDYSDLTGLVKTSEQTKRVLSSAAKDFARTGNQKQYMHSINKIVQSQKQLDASSRMNRSQLMQLGAEMQREAKFTDELSRATHRLSGAMGASRNKMNGSNMAVQQLGYQVGDFAVQVQGGTSAFVAFSQQGAQLAGMLPMIAGPLGLSMGAAVGLSAAFGILIPIGSAIGRMFFELKGDAAEAADKIEAFEEALKSANAETLDMVEALRLLRSGFETEAELALNDSLVQASAHYREMLVAKQNVANAPFESEANRLSAQTSAQKAVDAAKVLLDLARDNAQAHRDAAAALEAETRSQERAASVTNQLHETRQMLQRQAREEAAKYSDLVERTNASYKDQLALALAINTLGEDHADVARLRFEQEGRAKGLLEEELSLYVSQQMVLSRIVEATEASARAAAEFAKVDISVGVRAAAQAAQDLANHLGISLRAAMAMQGMISTRMTGDVFDPRDPSNQGSDAALERARRIMEGGNLTDSLIPTDSGGGGGNDFSQDEYLSALENEAKFRRTLVGLSAEQVTEDERRREIIMKIQSEGFVVEEARVEAILKTEAATRRAIAAEEQRQATFDMVSGHIESAFMAMVDGSKSVEDAFKGMIRSILLDVYQQAIAKPMANAITSFLGFKDGGAFSGGNVIPFANGGVVSSATMFPMAGKQTGVMGEAGPEAIMPLKRGANGKLGVQVQGGGENVVIHQNFNFQANGDDSVKRIIAQAAPQIANMTKKSMLDDRRRGGQMKTTFG